MRFPPATPKVPRQLRDTPYAKLPQVPFFHLTSKDVATGQQLPVAQASGNVSPQLAWSDFPERTESFVITMFDPDAPTGSGFWHWTAYNISKTTTSVPSGAGSPGGTALGPGVVQAVNDTGSTGYTGAAPPVGETHRYFITVSALDIAKVAVPADALPPIVGFSIRNHTLARAVLVPIFTGR